MALNENLTKKTNGLPHNASVGFKCLWTLQYLGGQLKIAKTQLADFNFFYDIDSDSLTCTRCSFQYKVNVSTFTELLRAHVTYCAARESTNAATMFCELVPSHKAFLTKMDASPIVPAATLPMQARLKYRERTERVQTFGEFQTSMREILIENGFFCIENGCYDGNAREVACAFCMYKCTLFRTSTLNNYYENLIEHHAKQSPNCKMTVSTQVSANASALEKTITKVNASHKAATPGTIQYVQGACNFDLLKMVLKKTSNATSNAPYHPQYAIEATRLASFAGKWKYVPLPSEYAKAGFFSIGKQDLVKCFYCNGGLRNLDPTDEVVSEHARWFPKCAFIRQLKGQDYIAKIREIYKNMDSGFDYDYDYNDPAQDYTDFYYDLPQPTSTPTTPTTPAAKRSVSPRAINAYMDRKSIQKMIELGFERSLVKDVITRKLRIDGDGFSNYVELARQCFEQKCAKQKQEREFKQSYHLSISNVNLEQITYKHVADVLATIAAEPVIVNKIETTSDSACGVLLIRVRDDDVQKCASLVSALHGKRFPNIESVNLVSVQLIEDNGDDNDINYDKDDDDDANPMSARSAELSIDDVAAEIATARERVQSSIAQEAETLKSERLCAICHHCPKDTVLLPCAHLVVCANCSIGLELCPKCGRRPEAIVKAFI